MSVRVIVEFQAKSGQRDELLGLFDRMMADGPPMLGSLGATFYKAVDDPDMVVEIADRESAGAREAVLGAGLDWLLLLRRRELRRAA
jgi:hypothetical protein